VLGPVISARHRKRVEAHIEAAHVDGARLACGGGRGTFDRGWYVEPTIFADVDNGMRIAQEEVFGPVLAIIAHEGDDDAVRIANDTRFGLSGAVFTPDLDRALDVAARIRVGTFGVNGYTLDFSLPFGGRKQSGVGREFGVEGLAENTEVKAIALPPGTDAAALV
jgi:betaine-aldehyde dehydrogenase